MRSLLQLCTLLVILGFAAPMLNAQALPTINQVSGVVVDRDGEGTSVRITSSDAPTFSVYQLAGPPRLFVDFSNTELGGQLTNWSVDDGVVDEVLILQYQDDISIVTRVVINLVQDGADYDVQTNGNSVIVWVAGATSSPVAQTDAAEVAMAEYESALRSLRGYQTEIDNQRERLVELSESSEDSRQEVTELGQELSRLRSDLAQRDTQIRDASDRETELRRQVEELQRDGSRGSELEIALREREAQSYTLRTLEAEYDGLLGQASDRSNELSEAESRLSEATEQRRSAQEQVAQSQQGMDDLIGVIESLEREVDAREAAIVQHQMAVGQLENEVERVLRQETEQRELAQALSEQVTHVEADLEEARRGEEQAVGEVGALRQRASELEQELDQIAGSREQRDGLQRELARVEEQLLTVEDELGEAALRRQQAEAQAQAAETALQQEQARLDEAIDQRGDAEQAAATARDELASTQSALDERRNEHNRVEREMQAALLQRETLNTDLQRLAGAQLAQESALVEARQEHASLAAETAELAETRAQTERDVELAQAQQAEAQQALLNLERERRDIESDLGSLSARRSEMESELAQMEQRLSEMGGDTGTDASTAPIANGEVTITDIRFEQTDGVDTVSIDFSGEGATVDSQPWLDGRASLQIDGATLSTELQRTLDTRAFDGPVEFLSSYSDETGVHVVANISGAASEILTDNGTRVTWEFSPTQSTWNSPMASQHDGYNSQEEASSAPPIQRSTGLSYTIGERNRQLHTPVLSRRFLVTIDVVNVSVTDILRMFSDQGDVNIVASNLSGNVSLRLRGVPLDEAFAMILQSQNLDFEQRGNMIRVAPIAQFEAERDRELADTARRFSLEPLQVRLRPINYASGATLAGQVSELLSGRGTVSFDERTHTLIMTDVSENLDAAEQLIDVLDLQTPQLLIEARVVSTGETFSRGFGIQWGGDGLFSPANGNATGLLFPSTVGISGGAGNSPADGTSATPNYAVNVPGPGTGAVGFQFGSLGQAVNLNLRLAAAEQTGSAKVVSAPRILTLDGQSATISTGVSIPVQSTGAAGANISFVNANLSLAVTPRVTPDGFVQLQLNVTKNEPDFARTGANGDPSIITRSVSTNLLVRDGETSVIGGVFEHVTGSDQNAVPFFADIPILGALFHDYQFTDDRSETLIFVTPRIINRDVSLTNYTPGGVLTAPTE